jgi:hypothetical protein
MNLQVTKTTDAMVNQPAVEGTLRWAIERSNATPEREIITFNIEALEPTILPSRALPQITKPVFIHAKHPTTEITLNGFGLTIAAANVTVFGLSIRGATDGIFLTTAATGAILNSNRVFNNSSYGIRIEGKNNTVDNNFIENNSLGGIAIRTATGTNNRVQNNDISRNLRNGIIIANQAAKNNIGPGNIITGNSENGIRVSDCNDNIIEGNSIGISRAGFTQGVGNGNSKDGISILGTDNKIKGNIISANAGHGISIMGSNTVVTGNSIGLNYDGSDDYDGKGRLTGNGKDGVYVSGGDDIEIGVIGQPNIISGNTGNGIFVDSSGAKGWRLRVWMWGYSRACFLLSNEKVHGPT